MEFHVLGPLEVSRAGAPVPIGSLMQRRLLTLLVLHEGAAVGADRVIDVLWGARPPPSARQGLHAYVSRLRSALGSGALLESDGHGYRLRREDHQVDAATFERLLATVHELGEGAPDRAAAVLKEALGLWRGPAYADFADEDFARPEAVRLDELRLSASEDWFAARLACGDTATIADLGAFASANPLRERPQVQLMIALCRAGRQREALEVFERVRLRLAEELGLDPSPALSQVQADILQQAPSVTLSAAEHGPGGQVAAGGRLPLPVTSFLGRRHETDAVCRLLERDRLVTLTGVGGVGKTRLALHVAAAVRSHYPDGVWWCELAPADADGVGHVVAAVLGVQQQAERTIVESIVGALAGKRLLLALDNCEHVAEATAQLVEQVLRRCGEVTVLATSRQPLAVDGEQVWVVPPLPLPADRADGVEAPSTQLFHDRARAHDVAFTAQDTTAAAVADICRQLDGLPLAIELAAALVPALEPAEIARRLGHRFRLLTRGPGSHPRHRSLSAVVEWSYQLLDPGEQHLFDRLAVFTGGFTLDAAEGVCADEDLPAEHVAGMLAGLVTRSMVGVDRSVTPARYQQLETLRHYAWQRLAERGTQQSWRERHAAWFVELALRLAAALYVFALHRLRDEVFDWAEQATGLPSATGHRLQPAVWGVVANGFSNRGELDQGRELAERALAAAPEPTARELYAAWHALGATALYEGRMDDCLSYTRQSVATVGRDGGAYEPVIAGVHEVLALVYGGRREAGMAATLALREAADTLAVPHLQAWSRYVHAEACGDDDPEQALALLEEPIALAEPIHGRFVEGAARHAVATLRARHHGPREALGSFRDVIEHWRRAGDWTHQWTTLRNVIPMLVRLNADEPAALLHGAQHAADTGASAFGADAGRIAEATRTLAGRLGSTAFDALVTQGGELSDHDAVDFALAAITDVLDAHGPTSARADGARQATGRRGAPADLHRG